MSFWRWYFIICGVIIAWGVVTIVFLLIVEKVVDHQSERERRRLNDTDRPPRAS